MVNEAQSSELAAWKRRRAAGMIAVVLFAAAAAVVGCHYMPLQEKRLAEALTEAATPEAERAAFVRINERTTWHAIRIFDVDNLLIPQSEHDRAYFVEIEWDEGTVVRRQLLDRRNLDVLFPQ